MDAIDVDVQLERQILHENLFRHIVLPRYMLPCQTPDFLCVELELLTRMVETVKQFVDYVPASTLKMIRSLAKVHTNLTANVIMEEINGLQPGETFAMFVRYQNCAIIIHMLPNVPADGNNIVVATFLAKVHPKEIYKNPSDLEYNYPTEAIKVKYSKMLRSEEFAKQLYFLCENKLVDSHKKHYVSKWLVTVLMDQDSSTAMEFPVIKKKIRDEILKTSTDYVRRSSFYMVIKALLQHSLTHELGEQMGKLLYKLVMIKFISDQSVFFHEHLCESVNVELAAQTLAKLARRIEKIFDISIDERDNSDNYNEYQDLMEKIILDVSTMIHEIRLKINSRIEMLQSALAEQSKLPPLVDLDFENDIIQKLPKLRNYLYKRMFMTANQTANNAILNVRAYHRHVMATPYPPNIQIFAILAVEIAQHLFISDFENWILYTLNPFEFRVNPIELRAWLFTYISYGELFHQGDPLGQSKIVLISLKLIEMLDIAAVLACPMLVEHHSGINPKIINSLLLPQFNDMKIAHNLQSYFEQRNENAKYPSLIGESQVTVASFGARFVKGDVWMQETLRAIQQIDDQNIAIKREEWTKGRKRVQELRIKASKLEHDYDHDDENKSQYTNKCKKSCNLCKVNNRIQCVKTHIYKRLLPDAPHEQNAIVFELRIPTEIACLRDTLSRFGQFIDPCVGNHVHITEKWSCYREIVAYNISGHNYCFLGNTKVTSNRTYPLHVDTDFSRFNVKNGYDCVYHTSNGGLLTKMADVDMKARCTLTVEDKYSCLQWTVNGTSHTQNEVLARQMDCPHDLSLSEFKNFGSLRADGHRLQWRNLYAAIETEALSFENSSVLSLVLQSIWQMEENGTASVIRESHEDLKCDKFVLAFVELLMKFVQQQKGNWSHSMKLVTVTLIAVRMFELNENENVANHITALLDMVRTVALDWMEKIQSAIRNQTKSNLTNQNQLRTKLIFAAASGALTFYVHSHHQHFKKIFLENNASGLTAPHIWLQFIVTLTHNITLSGGQSNELNLKMLLRMIRSAGIHIESTILEIAKENFEDVIEFIKKYWTQSEYGWFNRAYVEANGQVLVAEVILNEMLKYVTIDLITGSFLVNNMPICRLPNVITHTEGFQRVFDTVPFEVREDSPNSFTTVQKYNENTYEFMLNICGLVIIERHADGNEVELIPHDNLEGDIPSLLVENFSHWWNKCKNRIEFRPKQFNDKNFFASNGIEYIIDLQSCHLIHVKTNRNMLDITSKTYEKIVNQMSRLEQRRYIDVLMDDPNTIKIELIRMRLKFKIDCTKQQSHGYDIVSNEFSQMRISHQQNCGTLYGLEHGLLLEEVTNDDKTDVRLKKILLLPHGEVYTMCEILLNAHVSVGIDLESKLRTPPFHAYQVDEFCRQLKPNSSGYSAWFYLAYLHALTSHGQIEPFTGLSGTERALQILQSSFVWSSAPYDDETLKILHAFEKLSPRRKLDGKQLDIDWPTFVHPHSAQDSYILIVRKLLGDSKRLKDLYPEQNMRKEAYEEQDSTVDSVETDVNLNLRHYLHSLQLNPNLRVLDEFISHTTLVTSSPTIMYTNFSPNIQTIASLYHDQSYHLPHEFNLKTFLIDYIDDELPGPLETERILYILDNMQEMTENRQIFPRLWISFYEVARKHTLTSEHLTLILSLLAHHENDIDAILALQTIAANAEQFEDIDPPNAAIFYINDKQFDDREIYKILKESHSNPPEYYLNWTKGDRKNYDNNVQRNIQALCSSITEAWPCDSVVLEDIYYTHWDISDTEDINIPKASALINALLTKWNNVCKLEIFVERVAKKLHSLSTFEPNILPKLREYVSPAEKKWSKYEINWERNLCQSLNRSKVEVERAKRIWEHLALKQSSEMNISAADWFMCYEKILHSQRMRHLIDAGMSPRNVPTMILPKLIAKETDSRLKAIIGAWALAIAKEQRLDRISIYSGQSQLKPDLERELENEPHVNWTPNEYPEWLIFEIEQNLTIRRIQVEIAKQMLDENEMKSHFTMQLNMGEGKTAVIVPILASILANGQQVCQITVLKSLFATNLKSLRRYLGGMLGRKVYVFPCRRDLPMDKCIDQIQNIYEECKQNKGVILTLPEYRLSFQLKIYESIAKQRIGAARKFLQFHNWLNQNVRSILDECDAILNAKYQLIYTVGNQLQLDGGAQRWFVIQALLKRVPHHMKQLYEEHGAEKLEFNIDYITNGNVYGAPMVNYRDDVFFPCRILDHSMFDLLKEALIEDFLSGRIDIVSSGMTVEAKEKIRILLSGKAADTRMFEATLNYFNANERNTVLILCGLLHFEVLKLILTKRWRVNYGVDEKSDRKMAIPFKAKDVAADMTEFGHPDVALCFTQLSYYYSGLTDQQLLQAFQLLAMSQNAADIYEKWIGSITPELVNPSIEMYSGINLIDPHQRNDILFPLFRFNMHIIDFWLSRVVFLHEAKSFEQKLMCTAWDLCSEQMDLRVTGFSGTNDTKNLLPLSITQNDLEELESTNENVRKMLLQPENQCYKNLPANVSAKGILKQLANSKISILLDAGAIMLELNNKQVAEVWLRMASEANYDAALYFDARDVLQAIDRNGLVAEFDSSVYRENLSRCLVYLDDSHTRGTDLKFPLKSKACVTLSGEITRDKTVQACMRMRQLGKGHSIAFWASFEADINIRKTCDLSKKNEINNEHVVKFICANSRQFETENTVYWTVAAHNYIEKSVAHKMSQPNKVRLLYENCVNNEFVTLEEMYGDKEKILLTDISTRKFKKLIAQHSIDREIVRFIQDYDDKVTEKLSKLAKGVQRFVQTFDEEQEKETENEIEQERHVQRPPKSIPAKQTFDDDLILLIENGIGNDVQITNNLFRENLTIVPLTEALVKTKLYEKYENSDSPWNGRLYVTKNFTQVLENTDNKWCDEFLRPVWWIACVECIFILLSPYEVNHLLPHFRRSKISSLYMFRPRLSKIHSDLVNEMRLQVTGKSDPENINIHIATQIRMFSGSMYFKNDDEQNAYCNFLGLIPCPRTDEQEKAFKNGLIKPNGFVSDRTAAPTLKKYVQHCKFLENPIDLAIKLIKANHGFVRKESHVAAILERGIKLSINGKNTH